MLTWYLCVFLWFYRVCRPALLRYSILLLFFKGMYPLSPLWIRTCCRWHIPLANSLIMLLAYHLHTHYSFTCPCPQLIRNDGTPIFSSVEPVLGNNVQSVRLELTKLSCYLQSCTYRLSYDAKWLSGRVLDRRATGLSLTGVTVLCP